MIYKCKVFENTSLLTNEGEINALFIGENRESCDMCTCPEIGSKMDPCGSFDHLFAF